MTMETRRPLRMPELPPPPGFWTTVGDIVLGRIRQRLASIERRLDTQGDHIADHARAQADDYAKLHAYINRVALQAAHESKQADKRYSQVLAALANAGAGQAGVTRKLPLPPPHPSLLQTVEYSADEEPTTVIG